MKPPSMNWLMHLNGLARDQFKVLKWLKSGVSDLIEMASHNPEQFPPDKYKRNNTGNFRAFEIYSYRVSFFYSTSEIQILRVRHVRQKAHEILIVGY
jgi:plasmid stabilization system protein ParE